MKWEGKTKLNLQNPADPSKRVYLTGSMVDLIDYIGMGKAEAKRDPDMVRGLKNLEYWNHVLETVT